MKHVRPRMNVGKTDFERDLLRSWDSEQPSRAARQKALGLLVGVGVASVATTTKAAKAAKMAAASGSLPPKAATLGIGAAGKWILASVILTAAVGASVAQSKSTHEASVTAATATTSVQQTTPRASKAAPVSSAIDLPAASAPIATNASASATLAPQIQPVARPRVAVRDPATTAEAPSLDSQRSSLALGEEVAALDRARAASASGDQAGALQSLDAYDSRFPQGALAQESAALRIELLFKEGDIENGRLLADHFLAANPGSPHAARIRALLQP